MLHVFRFAWFAVRTFFGVIALVLGLYAALWLFVRVLSAAPGNPGPAAALGRVRSYNAPATGREQTTVAAPNDNSSACPESRSARCERP